MHRSYSLDDTNMPGRRSSVSSMHGPRRFSVSSITSGATASSRRSLNRGMTLLPEDFAPTNYSVLCGRGKGNYNAIGNRRLRIIVGSFLRQYEDAENNPHERARIVDTVVEMVRDACPVGGFIKSENGRYHELSDKAAREKCGALFRDCIQANIRSKQAQEKKKLMDQEEQDQDQQKLEPVCDEVFSWDPFPQIGGILGYADEVPSMMDTTFSSEPPPTKKLAREESSSSYGGSFYDVHTQDLRTL